MRNANITYPVDSSLCNSSLSAPQDASLIVHFTPNYPLRVESPGFSTIIWLAWKGPKSEHIGMVAKLWHGSQTDG